MLNWRGYWVVDLRALLLALSRERPGFRRAGYMGHLRSMANRLVSLLSGPEEAAAAWVPSFRTATTTEVGDDDFCDNIDDDHDDGVGQRVSLHAGVIESREMEVDGDGGGVIHKDATTYLLRDSLIKG